MREIKFRAWDKDQKRFRYDLVFTADSKRRQVWAWNNYVRGYSTQMNEECFEWVQFTGLKDKNGKEIWEGDVVQKDDTYSNEPSGRACYEIVFDEGTFSPKGWSYMTWTGRCEVVGNLYENPELLRK